MPTAGDGIVGLRVLIVEDEALIAESIGTGLERAGCNIVAAVDTGAAAIEAATELRPDLVLMDIHLKGEMDGIAAASIITERVRVPVVYLTAHSDRATLQRATASTAFGYVLKPFHRRALLVAIEVAINRFRLERRLEDNQLNFATIVGSLADAVMTTDVCGAVVFMNPVAEQLSGWSLGEAQGRSSRSIMRLVTRDGGAIEADPILVALKTQSALQLQNELSLEDRRSVRTAVEGTAAPVVDALGRLVGATLILRDVTAARLSKIHLRDMAERLSAVVDAVADGVMLLDAAGAILMFNPACVRLFGYSARQAIGQNVELLMPSPLRSAAGLRPLKTARVANARRKNGDTFHAEVSLGEVAYDGTKVFVTVVRDTSERDRMEAEVIGESDRERRQFAHELHEGLAQQLAGLALVIAALARAESNFEHADISELQGARLLAVQAVQTCREIARGLSPVADEYGGIVAALKAMIERVNEQPGPKARLSVSESARIELPPLAVDHLYRIAVEAIGNARRHAQATTIQVELAITDHALRLEIRDDGKGFDVHAIGARGLGIPTMRYRATAIGGSLCVDGSALGGTRVVCECAQNQVAG